MRSCFSQWEYPFTNSCQFGNFGTAAKNYCFRLTTVSSDDSCRAPLRPRKGRAAKDVYDLLADVVFDLIFAASSVRGPPELSALIGPSQLRGIAIGGVTRP
jgi:hypothetical protein